jgi:hypothetical protein
MRKTSGVAQQGLEMGSLRRKVAALGICRSAAVKVNVHRARQDQLTAGVNARFSGRVNAALKQGGDAPVDDGYIQRLDAVFSHHVTIGDDRVEDHRVIPLL